MNEEATASADLHAHTTASDGTMRPAELVEAAQQAGLGAVAVTDHDTVAGVPEAVAAARGAALEVIPGIEISCHLQGREVHLLGLFVSVTSPALDDLGVAQRRHRAARAEVIVERLIHLGVDIDMEGVLAAACGAPIGRPHIAHVLVERGVVPESQAAFDRFIGIGRPAHVPKESLPAVDAIRIIHEAGGAAVLAHPGSSRVRRPAILGLAETGLDGVEVRHPRHSAGQRRTFLELCERRGLLPSGGSDFHGAGRGESKLGQHRVPWAWRSALRQRAAEWRAASDEPPCAD